jgi:phosphonate transport system permease protein
MSTPIALAASQAQPLSLIEAAMRISPEAVNPPLWNRLKFWGIAALFIILMVAVGIDLDLNIGVISAGSSKLSVILGSMWPPSDGETAFRLWYAIAQTLGMAVLGTLLAAVAAIPVGLIAARNIVPNPIVHFVIRRTMDLFRGIPALVWALILVAAFGLGPIAGILALGFADIPRLGKLYAEAMENIDERQRESILATGAPITAVLRFGTFPQALPIWLSQCLYYLEQNFRSAAVVGIVGAGGIGFELNERIRIFAFDQVAYIIIIYIITVGLLDILSAKLRSKLV